MANAMTENDVVLLYIWLDTARYEEKKCSIFYLLMVVTMIYTIRDSAQRCLPKHCVICQQGELCYSSMLANPGAVEALSKIGEVKARAEQRRKAQANGVPSEIGIGVHVIAATMPLSYAVQLGSERSVLADTMLEILAEQTSISYGATDDRVRTKIIARQIGESCSF
jgi:hypothetical protein